MLESPLIQKHAPSKFSRPPKALADPFVFVPITKVEAAKGRGAAKRIVRAHVTRVQHSRSSNLVGQDLQNWTVKPYIHRDTVRVSRKIHNGQCSEKRRSNSRSEKSDVSATKQTQSPILARPKLQVGGSAGDPFWTYPIEYKPNLPPIFAHYIQNVAVEIPDIDGPSGKGLLRKCWFPLAMSDAATMYAILLLSASNYCALNPSRAGVLDLLALKARALSEINAALADPDRAVTDALIGAVAKVASYEAVFGDRANFTAHMKGLQIMVKLRGGLASLGLNGLLERMVVWIDFNGAHLLGTKATLGGEDFPTSVSFAVPDPYHFAGIS